MLAKPKFTSGTQGCSRLRDPVSLLRTREDYETSITRFHRQCLRSRRFLENLLQAFGGVIIKHKLHCDCHNAWQDLQHCSVGYVDPSWKVCANAAKSIRPLLVISSTNAPQPQP